MPELTAPAPQPQRILPPFSVSKIKMCDTCRFSAYLKYCKKTDGEYNPVTNSGKICHWGLEQYGKHCRQNKVEQDIEFAKQVVSTMRGRLTIEEWASIEGSFILYLERLKFPVSDTIGVEWDVAVDNEWKPLGFNDPNAYFRAKIDYIWFPDPTTAEIWDYKTGFNVMGFGNPVTGFQLRSYGVLIKALFPEVKTVRLRLLYTRFQFDLKEKMSVDDLVDAKQYINDKIADISADTIYEARIQDHCRLCSYAGYCPPFQRYRSDLNFEKIETQAQAQAMATKIYTTEQTLKKHKREIKAYIKKVGTEIVVGKDLVYGCNVRKNKIINNTPGLIQYLLGLGKTPEEKQLIKNIVWSKLNMTKTDLEAILKDAKKYALLDDALDKYGTVNPSNTWGIIKVGSDEESDEE